MYIAYSKYKLLKCTAERILHTNHKGDGELTHTFWTAGVFILVWCLSHWFADGVVGRTSGETPGETKARDGKDKGRAFVEITLTKTCCTRLYPPLRLKKKRWRNIICCVHMYMQGSKFDSQLTCGHV